MTKLENIASPYSNMRNKLKLKTIIFSSNFILFVIFVIILVICGFSVYTYFFNSQVETSVAKEHALVENSLRTTVASAQEHINVISLDFRLQSALSDLAEEPIITNQQVLSVGAVTGEVLSNVMYPGTNIVGGVITYENEVIYSGYNLSTQEAKRIITDEFIDELEKSDGYLWGELSTLNYLYGDIKNVIPVGKKIIDKQTGNHIGECILFLDERVLYETINYNATLGEVLILDENNNIISNNSLDFLFQPASSKYSFLTDEHLAAEGLYHSSVHYSVSHLNSWKIVTIVENDFLSDTFVVTLIYFSIIIVAYIIINLVLSNMVTMKVVRAVDDIQNRLELASSGDLSVRMVDNYPGELSAIATGFNYLMDTINNYIDKIYSQEQQKNELEFKVLQAQINPHFLYNTIETISSFVTLDRKAEAKKTALSLAKFYKLCLSNGQEFILIKEEIELLKSYIDIQSMRYSDYVAFELDIKDIDQFYIPKLTLQPIVENALYHGVKESNKKGNIYIHGYRENENIIITVEDNGVGIQKDRIEHLLNAERENRSFGIYNINSRLKLKYGNSYGITIASKPNVYTKVTVCIPTKKEKQ